MTKLVFTSVCLVSGLAFAEIETKDFEATGLKVVQVKNGSGKVQITPSKDDVVHVSAEKIDSDKDCVSTMERSGDKLVIEAKGKSGWFKSTSCEVNFTIQVPAATDIDLANGSGDLEVSDVTGKITFRTGSGSAKINGKIKNLDGRTGSGDVVVSLSEPLDQGHLDIRTGSGNATVFAPEAMKLMTEFKAGSGSVSNELGDSPESKYKVSMRAGSGDLKIKKMQSSRALPF